jgi:8-oxo-dGTP diphosphatase
MDRSNPSLTVDIIIYRGTGFVAIRRKNPPFQGQYALPGGFVEVGETTEEAAIREAKEETNLTITIVKLVGVYSDPNRDPRGHVVSICYLATGYGDLKGGDDAASAVVIDSKKVPLMAFDHERMIRDAGIL